MEQEDISSRTIFALVLLTVVVSFVGAFVTMSQLVDGSHETVEVARSTTTAQIGFVIEEEPVLPTSSAHIAFEIEPPE